MPLASLRRDVRAVFKTYLGLAIVNATAAPQKNRLWIWYFFILGVLTTAFLTILISFNLRQQLRPEQLRAAQDLWRGKGPRDYDFKYKQVATETESFEVRVRKGQATAVVRNGEPLEERLRRYHSMPALFAIMEANLERDQKPGSPRTYCIASFDAADGHLEHYIRSVMGSHERVEITIQEFAPVDSAAK